MKENGMIYNTKAPTWGKDPLPHEEQTELWRKYKAGDKDAGGELVATNIKIIMKFLWKAAFGYLRREPSLWDDLLSESITAFMHGLDKYEEGHGKTVVGYALMWIRAYVHKYLLKNVAAVSLGTTQSQRNMFFRMGKENRTHEEEEFSRAFEHLSLDEKKMKDGNGETFLDDLVYEEDDVEYMYEEEKVALQQAIEKLPKHERDAVYLTLLAEPRQTLNEVGAMYDVSRECIRLRRINGLNRVVRMLGLEVSAKEILERWEAEGGKRKVA